MAWTCGGLTNKELISNLVKNKIIASKAVEEAMNKVDRANYVPNLTTAYMDEPQTIGHGATISAPHMHAYAAEHLLPYLRPGAKVLDVGSGSGYLAAVFLHLVSPAGTVVGIEHISELTEWSIENLKKDGLSEALHSKNMQIITGDGRRGYPAEGPYDAIHVGAAAPIVPDVLVEQLASPGRMFIPVGTHTQNILHVDKDAAGNVTKEVIMGVRYVPLTDLSYYKS
ncbi:Pcmt1-prov protein [Cylindrobasidium torrendii FP15055 ss-10]|uniref:Protein-L-isoaspartate O-methyltransferase n=1 Tax=Cylindrobasidium torrendii FP15055 ss-10 TaxID=1314674 RepID=A0A0D7B0V1_9AGAR|nr:Pcmt1-prov protein [Cylindrobasidium torrendii FP15055 ss-10]